MPRTTTVNGRTQSVNGRTVGGTAIPDYPVDYRYVAEHFASPWPDETGTAAMMVTGLSASTFSNGEESVAGDGTSDSGTADGPQNLSGQESFGLALTVETTQSDAEMGVEDGNSHFTILHSGGIPRFQMRDSDGNAGRISSASIDDGGVHSIIINKVGDNPDDWEIFIDDMETDVASTALDQGFDNTKCSISEEYGFWANNKDGSLSDNWDADFGVFEFKSSSYTQAERDSFVDWRPEVS